MATTKIEGGLVDLNAGRPDYSLGATNSVSYLSNAGVNQYNFNGNYGLFGVTNGTFVLSSVSSSHPIAIINNGKTSEISYTGAVNEGTGTGPDGNTYTFYSGNVTITVSGNFDTVSYYCLNHGYMGGQNNLIYTNSIGEIGLKMPSGTINNRPTAIKGSTRNNTDASSGGSASSMEWYNGTAWQTSTNLGAAAITTNAVTNVGNTTFTANANVTDLGGAASVTAGFYIGTSSSYASNTKYTVSTSQGLGAFTYNATGLSMATTYYVTAFINNGLGEQVGATVSQATSFAPTLVSSGGSFFEVRSGSYTNPRLETNFIHPTTSVLTRIDFFEQGQGGVGQNPMNYNDVLYYVGINGCRGTYYGGFPAGKNFYNMWDNPGQTCYPQLRQASGIVNVTRAGFFYPGNMNSDNRMDLRNIPGGFNGNVVIDSAYDVNVTGGTKTQFGSNQCLRDNTSYSSGNGCWISLKYTLN